MAFDQYCNENVFGPLGMSETGWFLADLIQDHIAMPYGYFGGAYIPYGFYGFPDYPSGSLRTSMPQLARFLIPHVNGGALGAMQILSPETVELMHSEQFPELDTRYGLGFDLSTMVGGESLIGHDGGEAGVIADMYFRPDDGRGVCLVANGEPFAGGEFQAYWQIFTRLFEVGPVCPGDLNGDGMVDVLDLLAVLSAWGPCPDPPTACPGDINHDDAVDVLDMLALLKAWGPC